MRTGLKTHHKHYAVVDSVTEQGELVIISLFPQRNTWTHPVGFRAPSLWNTTWQACGSGGGCFCQHYKIARDYYHRVITLQLTGILKTLTQQQTYGIANCLTEHTAPREGTPSTHSAATVCPVIHCPSSLATKLNCKIIHKLTRVETLESRSFINGILQRI